MSKPWKWYSTLTPAVRMLWSVHSCRSSFLGNLCTSIPSISSQFRRSFYINTYATKAQLLLSHLVPLAIPAASPRHSLQLENFQMIKLPLQIIYTEQIVLLLYESRRASQRASQDDDRLPISFNDFVNAL